MDLKKRIGANKVLVIVLLSIVIIAIFLFSFRKEPNAPLDVKEVAGLYDAVEVGDLSFELVSVVLEKKHSWYVSKWGHDIYRDPQETPPEYYTMFWQFAVTNNGNKIENISDCGILLFEDGSQYNFKMSQYGLDISEKCNYYVMVPGAKKEVFSTFLFSDPSDAHFNWLNSPRLWEEIPGSKIIYFSQQNQGLVKYIVNKEEIIYRNITWTPWKP